MTKHLPRHAHGEHDTGGKGVGVSTGYGRVAVGRFDVFESASAIGEDPLSHFLDRTQLDWIIYAPYLGGSYVVACVCLWKQSTDTLLTRPAAGGEASTLVLAIIG
jgi:hypothetical protein